MVVGPGFVGAAQAHAILGIGPDWFDIFGDDKKSDLHHPRPDAEVSAQASRTTASRTTAGIAAAEAPTATVGSLPENGNAREFAAAENVGIPESVGRGGGGGLSRGEFHCPNGRPAKRFVRAGDAQHRDPRGSSIGRFGRRSARLRFARTASGARHRRPLAAPPPVAPEPAGRPAPAAPPAPSPSAPPAKDPLAPSDSGAARIPDSYRVGYAEYLRSATTGDLLMAALPGVAGIAGFTLVGAYAGYRQAKALQRALLAPVPTRILL